MLTTKATGLMNLYVDVDGHEKDISTVIGWHMSEVGCTCINTVVLHGVDRYIMVFRFIIFYVHT